MRSYQITDNRIRLYTLIPYRNHSKTQYYERFENSFLIRSRRLQKWIGRMWKWFGLFGK